DLPRGGVGSEAGILVTSLVRDLVGAGGVAAQAAKVDGVRRLVPDDFLLDRRVARVRFDVCQPFVHPVGRLQRGNRRGGQGGWESATAGWWGGAGALCPAPGEGKGGAGGGGGQGGR